MSDTLASFTNILTKCREIYIAKTTDYGTAWRILRPIALADQLYIKANRIRTIQENGETKVGDGVDGEFMAIVNYCIMAIIQIRHEAKINDDMSIEQAFVAYKAIEKEAFELMEKKNFKTT